MPSLMLEIFITSANFLRLYVLILWATFGTTGIQTLLYWISSSILRNANCKTVTL